MLASTCPPVPTTTNTSRPILRSFTTPRGHERTPWGHERTPWGHGGRISEPGWDQFSQQEKSTDVQGDPPPTEFLRPGAKNDLNQEPKKRHRQTKVTTVSLKVKLLTQIYN